MMIFRQQQQQQQQQPLNVLSQDSKRMKTSESSSAWFFPIQSSPSSDMWEIPHSVSTCTSSRITSTSTWLSLSPTDSFMSNTTTTPTSSMTVDDYDDVEYSYYSSHRQDRYQSRHDRPNNINDSRNNSDITMLFVDQNVVLASRDDQETVSDRRTGRSNEGQDGDDDERDGGVEVNNSTHVESGENVDSNRRRGGVGSGGGVQGLSSVPTTSTAPPLPSPTQQLQRRVVLGDATNTVISSRRDTTFQTTTTNNRDGVYLGNSNRPITVVRRSQFY